MSEVKDVEQSAVADAPEGEKFYAEHATDPIDKYFRVKERGSSYLGEIRAGVVLFMTSAYILFLNPLILSGGSGGTITGMPASDIVLATAISSGTATFFMGVVANYPWVVSVQLGTNTYFVNNLLVPNTPCGYHAFLQGQDKTPGCSAVPCKCQLSGNTTTVDIIGTAANPGKCFGTKNACLGTEIPFEKALACTFLEGLVFLAICLSGLRAVILRAFPKTILMAGAAGIGVFIAFVGVKDMGLVVAAPYPTLLQFNVEVPYTVGGWGKPGYHSGVGFNDCKMYFGGPPFGPVCPWLSVGGLVFTGLLLLWNINGAFIMGIFFTMFISWIKFPDSIAKGGLVPPKVADIPKFTTTAGAMDFNWSEGGHMKDLVSGFITFLYLDFIGSCITFVSMGEMQGILNEKGDLPRSNLAFIADAIGSMMGGLLGSSALTTYVESASAVREGGRTGLTAIVCSLFFFASCFLWPLFSNIPSIATGPILVLIGVLIFMSSIRDIRWGDLSEALPAFITIIGMPFTSNIAYGVIGGIIAYALAKFFTYQLFDFQKTWPGRATFLKWNADRSLWMRIPGWNCEPDYKRPKDWTTRLDEYRGLEGIVAKYLPEQDYGAPQEDVVKRHGGM